MASNETDERISTSCETVTEQNEENVAKNEEFVFLQPKLVEKKEEEKLKSKYPNLPRGGGLLMKKRLQGGGQKYFDSGDYAMAQAKLSISKQPRPPPENIIKQEAVGETIPTPENIQARKPSLVTSKLVSGGELL